MTFGPHTKYKWISTTHTKNKSIDLHTKTSHFRPEYKNNFDHPHKEQSITTWKQLIFGPHKKLTSIAISALKPSKFRSIHENQKVVGPNTTTKSISTPRSRKINFDTHIKTKSISIPLQKTKLISTASLKQSQFRCHPPIKSISMPRHKNRLNFDPDTKNKFFLTATHKPSQFWSLHRNHGQFRSPHRSHVNFDDHHCSQTISSLHWNRSSSTPHTEIKSILITHKKTK